MLVLGRIPSLMLCITGLRSCVGPTPVETRGVSLVELLISFKLETGLNVPVANPDDPGSFTLSRIKPAVSDLTSLGDESAILQCHPSS